MRSGLNVRWRERRGRREEGGGEGETFYVSHFLLIRDSLPERDTRSAVAAAAAAAAIAATASATSTTTTTTSTTSTSRSNSPETSSGDYLEGFFPIPLLIMS